VFVAVTTASGTGTSATQIYTYADAPTVTAVSPPAGPLNGGQSVTITGSGFVTGQTTITFDTTPATNVVVVDSSHITATTPAHAAGAVKISATTPAGMGTSTTPLYTYTSLPVVTSITPSSGPIAGGQPVTISGQNFANATSVTIGGLAVGTFTVGGGGTTISTTTPGPHAPGQVNVVVTTPLGSGTGTNIYTYVTPVTLVSTPAATQQVGKTYSQQNTASGGTPPYTYALTGGSLPPGTSLSSSTGLVFGTATASGPYSYTITATDSTVPPQTASVTVSGNIAGIVSSVTLTSSVNPSLLGQPTTFTAAVTPNTCTGTLTFSDGGNPLCNLVPTTNGVASCTVKFNTAGAHTIKASYSGSAQCSASSATLTQTVNDQRPQTVSTIGNFLSRRNDLILSSEPDRKREVDRLAEANDAMDGKPIRNVPFAVVATGLGTASNLGAATGNPAGFAGTGFASPPQFMMSPNGMGYGGMFSGTRSPLAMGTSVSSINGMPDSNAPMGAGSIAAGPMRLMGSSDGLTTFGFSTSLRDMLHYSAAMDAAKAADAGQGFAAGSKYNPGAYYSPFDIWAEGKYTSFRDTSLPGNMNNAQSGVFGLFTVGADYVFNRWLLAGVMAQYDLLNQHTPSAGAMASASGGGWTVGPYATVRLSENVFWQARGAWGQSSNQVSPYGTYTNNFDSQRWLGSTALQGRWTYGNWIFRPSASVAYMQDNSKSYYDTFGVLIPEVKSELGQAKAGPEVGLRFQYSPDLIIEPHVGVQAIYNFAGNVTSSIGVIPGENAGPNGVRGRVEVGQRAVTSGGVALDLAGSYDGIGVKGYDAYSARAQVHLPLD
jgi:outer membrane autotransporter protein